MGRAVARMLDPGSWPMPTLAHDVGVVEHTQRATCVQKACVSHGKVKEKALHATGLPVFPRAARNCSSQIFWMISSPACSCSSSCRWSNARCYYDHSDSFAQPRNALLTTQSTKQKSRAMRAQQLHCTQRADRYGH